MELPLQMIFIHMGFIGMTKSFTHILIMIQIGYYLSITPQLATGKGQVLITQDDRILGSFQRTNVPPLIPIFISFSMLQLEGLMDTFRMALEISLGMIAQLGRVHNFLTTKVSGFQPGKRKIAQCKWTGLKFGICKEIMTK